MIDSNTVLTRTERIRWTNVGDDIVLMDPENESYYQLNATAAVVWELADSKSTVADMVREICAGFECDPATAEADVKELIGVLLERGLVQLSGGTPA
ncbi:MAG: PqqD family protein [Acetobacteraceae bacterium]|nr:PqqD family protein [Acetobacteraceae bacterium]